ncbi:uncharacterized protein LOC119186167 [Rhipicephalus microplus]|uniref:uncharacterized protein LOC119186167 n=1 Tax=Rhipicephalus microplus TaxID=6941 RepID=UPI003F6CD57C
MADKRTKDDDSEREQRKRPPEDDTSHHGDAKVPRLLAKNRSSEKFPAHEKAKPNDDINNRDKRPLGTDTSGEEREPKRRRVTGEDEEDKNCGNAREADHESAKDSKDTDNKGANNDKDSENKDADTSDKQSTAEDKTAGENDPKERKVSDEDKDKTVQDADTNDEKAADKEGDDEKKEGGDEAQEKKQECAEDEKDVDGNVQADEDDDDDDDEEEDERFGIAFVMNRDEYGQWHIKKVLISKEGNEEEEEEEIESEGTETSGDTEGETTGEDDDLLAILSTLLGEKVTEENNEEDNKSVEPQTSEDSGRDSAEGACSEDEDEGGATKTAGKETTEDEKHDEAVEESEEGDAEMEEEEDDGTEDPVTLHVMYNKQCYDIELPLSASMSRLKKAITRKTGIQPSMQKLCYKGATQPQDSKSLRDHGLSANAKILMVGSTAQDVSAVKEPPKPTKSSKKSPLARKLPFCKQEFAGTHTVLEARNGGMAWNGGTVCGMHVFPNGFSQVHKAIIDDGVPEDAFPGICNAHDDLPNEPIAGMLNSRRQKVRLTFKLEEDQFWVSTREETQKHLIPDVLAVISQPIEGHEEYHIMCILPSLLAEPLWLYWVPAQYVRAIKETLLGRN